MRRTGSWSHAFAVRSAQLRARSSGPCVTVRWARRRSDADWRRAPALATVAISGRPASSAASALLCVGPELLKAWLHHLRSSKASVSLAAGFLGVASGGEKKLLFLDQGISSSSYWEIKNEMVGNQSSNILNYVGFLFLFLALEVARIWLS